VVIRNLGVQLSRFSDQRQELPIDFQIGYSKRLAHLPFRWMVTMHNIHKWDLRTSLDDQNGVIVIGQEAAQTSGLSASVDNFFRHLTFGGEFLIGSKQAFRLRFGYDHLRNRELSLDNFMSLSGFSFGFGIKVKKWRLDYGVGRYHLAGSANHIGLVLDLDTFFKKI